MPAVLARAADTASRVEVCVLVEGYIVAGVRIAEYVAAAPTVMPSSPVAKVFCASGFVAD